MGFGLAGLRIKDVPEGKLFTVSYKFTYPDRGVVAPWPAKHQKISGHHKI